MNDLSGISTGYVRSVEMGNVRQFVSLMDYLDPLWMSSDRALRTRTVQWLSHAAFGSRVAPKVERAEPMDAIVIDG